VFVDANESLAVIFDRLRKSGDPDVRVHLDHAGAVSGHP
jgi:D-3-phosphoglycerate dehydrogenase / 2-oxoglutarate reductase